MPPRLTTEQAGDDRLIDPLLEQCDLSDDDLRQLLKSLAALSRCHDPQRILDLVVSTILLIMPVAGVWAGSARIGDAVGYAVAFDPTSADSASVVSADRLEQALAAWSSRLGAGQPPFEVDAGHMPVLSASGDTAVLTVFPMSSSAAIGALVLGAPLEQLSAAVAAVGLICERAASALQLSAMHAAGERAEALAEALAELAASYSDPELVLQVVVRRTAALLKSHAAYVMLVDPHGKTLRVRTAHGVTGGAFYDAAYSVDGPLVGAAIDERRVVCVRDVQASDAGERSMSEGLHATMCAPMFAEDCLVGVLLAAHRDVRGFSIDDREAIAALADAAALSIANARLYAAREGAIDDLADVNRLLAERSTAGESAMAFQQRLTALILQVVGLDQIVQVISETLECQVLILDGEFSCLYASRGAGVGVADLRRLIESLPEAPGITRAQLEERQLLIAPLTVTGAPHAYLVAIWDGAVPHETDPDMMIETAVTAIGIELMRDREAIEAEARLTGDLFSSLLTDDDADELTILRRASHFGYELGGFNAAIAVMGAEQGTGRRPLNLGTCVQRAIRRRHERNSVVFEHDKAIFVVVSGHDGVSSDMLKESAVTIKQELAFSDPSNTTRIAYAGPHPGVAGVRRAVREAGYALRVLDVLGRHGTPLGFDELGVWALLGGVGDARQLVSFAEDTLGALITYDAERQSQLVETVRGLAECNFHYRTAAEMLFTHPNTLRYRMARINELTGLDFTNADDRLKAEIAVRILDVIARPQQ